ncbi:helix-turn-helix domain-containing protein [Candidatus Woesearchaeota archaeon]|nr:helix-turn-helix domain-containing protein [Candidatus Woesearchaeota archaeon]
MYKLSFKVRHRGCFETKFSMDFPKHHIAVVDIQSTNPKKKQYFYYITGDSTKFDDIAAYLKKSKHYIRADEIERSKETLLILVELYQSNYIQNIIQKHHGFFIETHTCYEGYEYWHVGLVNKESIQKMLKEFRRMGELHVLHIGEVQFETTLLSKQQRKVFKYAYEQGYYNIPRKTTIARIAKALRIDSATAGEHLMKAENKLINLIAKKL